MKNVPGFLIHIRSYLSNSAYLFASMILERALFFFLFMFMARKLAPGIYGEIVVIFTFANVLSSLFEFGFPVYFQRESAASSVKLQKELSTAVLSKICSFILFLAFLFLYLGVYSGAELLGIFLIGTSVFIFSLNIIIISVLYGRQLFKLSFWGLLTGRIPVVLSLMIYYFFPVSSNIAVSGFLLSGLFHFAVLYRILRQIDLGLTFIFETDTLKNILKSSSVIYFGYIFIWLYDKLDVLILKQYSGYEQVALYTVAYSVYKLPQILAGGLFVPMFSSLSRQYSEEKVLDKRKLLRIALILILFICILSVCIGLFPSEIINAIYGSNYYASGKYLKLLLFAVPALLLNNMTGIISNTVREEKIGMKGAFYGAVVNIIICFVLIPSLGIIGAVIATILAEYSVLAVEIYLLAKLNNRKVIFT